MLGVSLSPSQQYLLRHDLTLNVETRLLDWLEEPQVYLMGLQMCCLYQGLHDYRAGTTT